MAAGERGKGSVPERGLAAVGVAALPVACCAGLPPLAALAGGVALGTLLGVGGGLFAGLVVAAALAARARRRHTGAVTGARRPSSFLRHENRQ